MLDDMMKEMKDLKKAKELLERIWYSFAPYEHRKVFSDGLSRELEEYFKFDDSE